MFCDKCGTENRDGAEFCINCGTRMSLTEIPSNETKPGHVTSAGVDRETEYLDRFKQYVSARYEIIRELGRGGMAVVFLAHDKRLERKVALKVLPYVYSQDKNFAERFLHEAKISAKLSHPNIIQIHDVSSKDEFIYYSMSFIEGVSLSEIIGKSGSIHPKVIARLGIHICFAIQHAHEKGVIHRDIKPENILINKKRMPIVVDFGIAKAIRGTRLSQTGMFIGTPQYMSPEQIKAGDIDGRSDIYSLGCLLYEMAVGKPPFHGLEPTALMYNHVNVMPPSPREKNKDVPKALSEIIMKALAKDPNNRPQSAKELSKILHDAVLSESSEKTEVTSSKKTLSKDEIISDSALKDKTLQSDQTVLMPAEHKPMEIDEPGSVKDSETLIMKKVVKKPQKKKTPSLKKKKKGISLFTLILGILGILTVGMYGYFLLLMKQPEPSQSLTPMQKPPSQEITENQQKPPQDKSAITKQAIPPKEDITKQTISVSKRKTPPPTPPIKKKTETGVTDKQKKPLASEPNKVTQGEIKPEKPPVKKPPEKRKLLTPITWVRIQGSVFKMGDSQGDLPEEMMCLPVHSVIVSSFEMSSDEISVRHYSEFIESTGHNEPDEWRIQRANPDRPVVFVSWYDAVSFAGWKDARLPTEAEWEYASRAGFDKQSYTWGTDLPQGRANFGNEWENGNGWKKYLLKPGMFASNGFGLNDMAGNVWEWCSDRFGPYQADSAVNPAGSMTGTLRVVRGGGWNSKIMHIRNAVRGGREPVYKGPHTGFRLVRGI